MGLGFIKNMGWLDSIRYNSNSSSLHERKTDMAVILFNKVRKWLNERRVWCNLIAATVAISIFGPLTYMALDRELPFRLKDGITIPEVIQAGSFYQTSWTVFPIKYCPGYVTINIIDSQKATTTIASQPSYFNQVGTKHEWTRINSLPRIMPSRVAPGKATVYVKNEFYCNVLQKWLNWPIIKQHPPIYTYILPDPGFKGEQGIQGKQGEPGKDK